MFNRAVRLAMFEKQIKQWQLAKLMGISEAHMSRLLSRRELPDELQAEMIMKIEEAANA